MIKINLCPIDELESQYWYLPDLAVAALVLISTFFGVKYYLGTIQKEIDTLSESTASLEASYQQLAPELKRFKTLDQDIAALNIKLKALQLITVSKISKYKPVIVLEHFQNLKPEGVWYSYLKYKEDHTFELKAQAFDNILVAELIAAVRSTASQEADEADMRTQIFFQNIQLDQTQLLQQPPQGFPELAGFPEMLLKGKVSERAGIAVELMPSDNETVSYQDTFSRSKAPL